jgi:hypothetical protein
VVIQGTIIHRHEYSVIPVSGDGDSSLHIFNALIYEKPKRSRKRPCNFNDRFMCTKYMINVQHWEDPTHVYELLRW